jgi:hypothetical protein
LLPEDFPEGSRQREENGLAQLFDFLAEREELEAATPTL